MYLSVKVEILGGSTPAVPLAAGNHRKKVSQCVFLPLGYNAQGYFLEKLAFLKDLCYNEGKSFSLGLIAVKS